MQSSIWVPVIAAILSSLLTGALFIMQEFVREHIRRKAQRTRAKNDAYCQLLVTSGLMMQSAGTLRTLLQTRSGLAEAVDLLLHIRQPVDLFQLDKLMRDDLTPLFQAWSLVWIAGSREAIEISNELVVKASELVQLATTPGTQRKCIQTLLLAQPLQGAISADQRASAELPSE